MANRGMARTALLAGIVPLAVLMAGCKVAKESSACKLDAGATGGNAARLEHVALNVADPIKMTRWYVDNLGMKVLREGPPPANARFLADHDGNAMLELYHNASVAVPNYATMDPLVLHVAFMVDDVDAVRRKLLAAGATPAGEVTPPGNTDNMTMLRDPWGLAIQFVHRVNPMLPAAGPSHRR